MGSTYEDLFLCTLNHDSIKEVMIEAIDDSRKATKGGKKASSSWWTF